MFKRLYGVVCATITPMHEDGNIDKESVRSLCAHLNRSGIHGLYLNGTNGESLTLTTQERSLVSSLFIEENSGKASLFVQCGAATINETIDNLHQACNLGADGAGVMTPIFFPVDDASMRGYFERIFAELPDFPMYIYNFPDRTSNDISPTLLDELMRRHKNLLGIKNSSPDLQRILAYLYRCERAPDILIGADSMALCNMAVGGVGWVSGPAAVFPARHVRLYRQIQSGDYDSARDTLRKIWEIRQMMGHIPMIPATKYLLMRQGIIAHDFCRLPFRPLEQAERQTLDAVLEQYVQDEGSEMEQ